MSNGVGVVRPYGREKTDDDWQAESDARTLANAAEIKMDPVRFKKAKEAIQYLIKEKQDKIKTFKSVKV